MAGELMIPMLPCADIDAIRDFYLPMGFHVTYRQLRPNPYLALKREDIDLHYFGMDNFKPEDSYGTCRDYRRGHSAPVRRLRRGPAAAVRQTAGERLSPDHPPPEAQECREPQRLQPHRPQRELDPGHDRTKGRSVAAPARH